MITSQQRGAHKSWEGRSYKQCQCLICGKTFYGRNAKFCSTECYSLYESQTRVPKDIIDIKYEQAEWKIVQDALSEEEGGFSRNSKFLNLDFSYMLMNRSLTEGSKVQHIKSKAKYIVEYKIQSMSNQLYHFDINNYLSPYNKSKGD